MFRTISEAFPDVTGSETGRAVTTVMVAPDAGWSKRAGRFKRVFVTRITLDREKGKRSAFASKTGTWGGWGWVPWRGQHLQNAEKARGRLGQVKMTIDDRGYVVKRGMIHNTLDHEHDRINMISPLK